MKLYDETMAYMNDAYPFMCTYVLAMGPPVDDQRVDLACIEWWQKKDVLQFHLNAKNIEPLNMEERCFVFLHETFHVMLNHHHLPFPDKKKANVAADVVINDCLVHRGMPKFDGLLYGEEVIGQDSFGLTVKEVYDLIPNNAGGEGEGGGEGLKGAMQPDGTCGNSHELDHLSVPEKIQRMATAELQNAAREKSEQSGSLAGDGATDLQEWAIDNKVELAWAQILDRIAPSVFAGSGVGKRRSTFNRLHRKVAWSAPEVILPVYRDTPFKGIDKGKIPSLVLAIDTSTSISEETYRRFFRIAATIPQKKVKLRTISFTTRVQEFELSNPTYARGGTSFQCVDDWIRQKLPEYPDGVVVFTDGEARFSRKPKELDRWHWFICDGGYDLAGVASQSGTWDSIERFVK